MLLRLRLVPRSNVGPCVFAPVSGPFEDGPEIAVQHGVDHGPSLAQGEHDALDQAPYGGRRRVAVLRMVQRLGEPRHLPKSPIAEVLNYARNRRGQLEAWLSDTEVPIDTNHPERGLLVLPLGRKNWLFCWTEVGAVAVGIVQSPVATCRLQGVDPRACLEDVLRRVSVHPSSRVGEPAPRRWKDLFAGDPVESDLGTGVEYRASDPPGAG